MYSLNTRTWTVWLTTAFVAIGQMISRTDLTTQYEEAICFTAKTIATGSGRVAKTIHIVDNFVAGKSETITCRIRTKNFNYQSGATYKRLFWWGVDASFRGVTVGEVTPITFNQAVTWSALATYLWSDLSAYSWEQPISPTTAVTDTKTTMGSAAIRKFVKFMKALRFRQVNYAVTFTSDGTPDTSPVRLFSVTT